MNDQHPDVMVYTSYAGGEEVHRLRIVTWETADFPHGLGLEYEFKGEGRRERAEAFAIKVQEYVNLLRADP